MKMNVAGNSLVYSTYLGGSSLDSANDIDIDGDRDIYITGITWSDNFPIYKAYEMNKGGADAFITCLLSNASGLRYSTYLGGVGYDVGEGIRADSWGNVYLTGNTTSTDFNATSHCHCLA